MCLCVVKRIWFSTDYFVDFLKQSIICTAFQNLPFNDTETILYKEFLVSLQI